MVPHKDDDNNASMVEFINEFSLVTHPSCQSTIFARKDDNNEFKDEFSLVAPITPKKRSSIFAHEDDNDGSTGLSGFVLPKLEK
jgi:hypothetical protein